MHWSFNFRRSNVFNNRCRRSLFFHWLGLFGNLLCDRAIFLSNQLRLFVYRGRDRFRMSRFNLDRSWLCNRCLRFDHFWLLAGSCGFNRCLRLNNVSLRGGDQLGFSYGWGNFMLCCMLLLGFQRAVVLDLLLLFLRTWHRIANPHFTGSHLRRGAGDSQRHGGLYRVALVTVATAALTADAQVTRGAA